MAKTELQRKKITLQIIRRQLEMTDLEYQTALFSVIKKKSSKALSLAEVNLVLKFFKSLSPSNAQKQFPGEPTHLLNDKKLGPSLRKIRAFLSEAKRPWSYVNTIAYRKFKKHHVAWCTLRQLWQINQILEKDAINNGRYTGPK
ncbi:MAG: DUF1018 domain-containing protein [Magnetococcales bacterium]|nr:DUF1018 domain-containing protein [Magnetococcales bacterium]